MSRLVVCPQCHLDFQSEILTEAVVRCAHCEHEFVIVAVSLPQPIPVVSPVAVTDTEESQPGFGALPRFPSASESNPDGAPWVAEDSWCRFAIGCRWVTVGLLIELASVTVIILLLLTHLCMIAARDLNARRAEAMSEKWTPYPIVRILLIGVVTGTAVVACGRTRQASVPSGSGVAGPLWGAMVLGWLQFLATFSCAGFTVAGMLAEWHSKVREYYDGALRCLAGALLARALTDISAAVALGLVGGAMPSRALRTRVARVTVAFQVLSLCYTGLFLAMILTRTNTPAPMPARPDDGEILIASLAVTGIGYALYLGYTLLSLSLHTAARRAALES
jgi:hypothetical protein